jgi:hypothetical protein
MIHRIRSGLQGLFSRRRRRSREQFPEVRGTARNLIVVKSRDPRFQEILYVLRDDYFSDPGCDREELLRQAKEAARRETGEILPAGRRLSLWPAALLLLGALAILKLTGMI